jgi:hypothetical protein
MHYRNRLIEELQTATLPQALALIDDLIEAAQSDIKFLKLQRSKIESLISSDGGIIQSPDTNAGPTKVSIPERVIEVLSQEGQLTWAELYSHLNGIRPGTIYANVKNKMADRVEIVKIVGKLDTVRLKTPGVKDQTASEA